jgi:hypothetical protein
MKTKVDLLGLNGNAKGEIAREIQNNGRLDIGAMRPFIDLKTGRSYVSVYRGGDPKNPANYRVMPLQTNATLRRDEWKALDDAILDVSRERLGGIQDLEDNKLTYNLGNAMGTTVLEWHDSSDAMEAVVTMDGITRSKGDRVKFQHNYLPIPIIHVDYEINARVLAASRNMGNPLDTTSAERAARKVLEKLEAMLFTDITYGFGELDSRSRNKIYSYINHPDRNILTMTTHWDDLSSGEIGDAIIADVIRMKQASLDALHRGPWTLYIPSNYETVLDKDYNSTAKTTIRARILEIDGIKKIKVIDTLPADNVLLVQMTKDVVRLVKGLGLQNVEWSEEGKFVTKYKVLTIQVPQIRSDQNGKTGIVHLA